jgi:hypothetical protein
MVAVFSVVALINLVGVIVCRNVAKSRGLNVIFWTTMGIVFGPFAIPFVLKTKHIAA